MNMLERQLAGSISLGRQNRAAKGLRDAWARYQHALSVKAKYRHGASPMADLEVSRSAEAFAEIAAAALGLETNKIVVLRTTISDEDTE
jgi:hypothetical protein